MPLHQDDTAQLRRNKIDTYFQLGWWRPAQAAASTLALTKDKAADTAECQGDAVATVAKVARMS